MSHHSPIRSIDETVFHSCVEFYELYHIFSGIVLLMKIFIPDFVLKGVRNIN